MSTYTMIPSDRLLPPASIMEKIKAFDETAPAVIFDLSEAIAEQGRKIENMLLDLPKPFLKSLGDMFNASRIPDMARGSILTAAEAQNLDWAKTGNNMRRGILQYLEDRPDIAAKIDLSSEEKAALQPIPLWMSAAKAAYIFRLPKNVQTEVAQRLDLALHA